MTHIFSDNMININNSIFEKLLLKFVIFRNTSFEFFDQNDEKMFTILFRKDFIIDFYKYKIVKRVKEGIKTKKLVLCDIISINNQFKLWSIAWNGLRSINKDNFYENLIINRSKIKSSMLKGNQIKKDFFIFHCVHYFFVSIIKC